MSEAARARRAQRLAEAIQDLMVERGAPNNVAMAASLTVAAANAAAGGCEPAEFGEYARLVLLHVRSGTGLGQPRRRRPASPPPPVALPDDDGGPTTIH